MKILEVTTFEPELNEGGDATGKRFFSELGALTAWAGYGGTPDFDPDHPEKWLNPKKLENPEKVFEDIRINLGKANDADAKLPEKKQNKFGIDGYYQVSMKAKDLILTDMSSKGMSPPKKFGWVGTLNASSVGATPSDVDFVGSDVAGISIKDDGGIGLANLGAGELEFEGKGDLLMRLAPEQMIALKTAVMTDLLKVVKSQGRYEARGKPYYNMSYDKKTQQFVVEAKGKTITTTAQELMSPAFLKKTSPYQRCLGDFYLANLDSYLDPAGAVLKQTCKKIGTAIQTKVLNNATKLAKLGGFGASPYYYQLASPFKVAFVPDLNTATDIEVVKITPPTALTSGLKFMIALRRKGVKGYATVECYIRYASGVFGSAPTFRIQSLKGHENLYWQVLT